MKNNILLLLNKIPSIIKQLLAVWLAFFAMVSISYLFVRNIVDDYLAKEAENILSYTYSKIATDLREGETTLQGTSQSIQNMILRGSSADEVYDYMIDITEYLSSDKARISGLNGVYGFFHVFGGMFLHGTGWIPPEDYEATERPWYKAAVEGNGIEATTLYINALTEETVISYSRNIFDRDGNSLGVVCVDVDMNKVAGYIIDMHLAEGGYGILISDNMEIVATRTREYIGKHSSILPYKDISDLLRVLERGIDIYEYPIIDERSGLEYVLFSKQLDNGWHIGLLTPIGEYYQKVKTMRAFIAMLGVFLALLLSIVLLRIAQAKKKADEKSLEAKAASKAKSDFLAKMSHEIRTPMNAIIGMTSIALSAEDSNRKNYCLEKIDDASKHLLGVINDILDISKIEAGKFELYLVEFDFEKMIDRVVHINQTRIDEKKQKLSIHIDTAIPRALYGDEQRLAQVITNLVGNAVKFTPEEGTISIKAQYIGEADRVCTVQISITDSGIGISPEQQSRLFQSFEQADKSTANKYGGTGLGLAISKDIIEKMGGKIWIESEPGKGAAFIFTCKLPIGANNAYKSNSENTAKITAADLYNELHGKKLLIVEDIDINREIIIALLDGTGLIIDTAENGKEALDLVISDPTQYDFIFMDVQMPIMDGYEATRQIRAYEAEHSAAGRIPIIAMTANVFQEDIDKCQGAGMDDHIGKPLNLEDVLNKLQMYLAQKTTGT